MANGNHQWEIYRFEFVYFDPRFRRWQYFQENADLLLRAGDSTALMAPHRRLIQQLLSTVRGVVKGIVQETAFAVAEQPKNQWIDFDAGAINARLFRDVPEGFRRMYLAYLAEEALKQGVGATQANELRDFLRSPELESFVTRKQGKKRLSAEAALELLSLLPVLATWELPGRFLEAWENSDGGATRVPSGHERRFPPDRFEDRTWRDPHYLARFQYGPPDLAGTFRKRKTTSEILGYDLKVEAVCTDLSSHDARPTAVELRDYFAYCDYPTGDHQHLYHLYSFFLDHILRNLTGEAEEAEKKSRQHISFFGYPVSVPGWNHFLQIYVRPVAVNEQGRDLMRLWNDWQVINSRLLQSGLRQFLSETMQRVNAALFQKEVGTALTDALRLKNQLKESEIYELLCAHGCSLFPFASLQVSEGPAYAYVPYRYGDSEALMGEPALIGEHWASSSNSTTQGEPVLDGRILVNLSQHGTRDTGVLTELTDRGRVIQLFEQQHVYVRTLMDAAQQRISNDEKHRREAEVWLERELAGLSPSVRASIYWQAARGIDVDKELADYPGKNLRDLAGRCVVSSDNKVKDDERIRSLSMRYAAPSVPLAVSEYFGLGPIKRVTHESHFYYRGRLADMLAIANRIYEQAKGAAERAVPGDSYLPVMENFHTEAQKFLTGIDRSLNQKELQDQNQSPHLREVSGLLTSERKDKHSFKLDWNVERGLIVDGASRPPSPFHEFEIHWPIHETLSEQFAKLHNYIKSCSKPTILSAFGAATIESYSHPYVGPNGPVIFKNYLIATYFDKAFTKSYFLTHPPDVLEPFDNRNFRDFGRLHICLFDEGQTEDVLLYSCHHGDDTRKTHLEAVPFESVFPLPLEVTAQIRRKVFDGLGPGYTVLVFDFDSWRHDL